MQTGEAQITKINERLTAYLKQVQRAIRLEPQQEQDILRELEANILECAAGIHEGCPELSQEEVLELALQEFGPPDELGRTFHSAYRHALSLPELALLAAFPFALVPLLGVDWAGFARVPEPNGWWAFGTSAILLTVGMLFAKRLRSPVALVWMTALFALGGSMAFATFRELFEPRPLLSLATTPGIPEQKIAIPAEQVVNYQALISWWSMVRYAFMLTLILFYVYWLLRLARHEWTHASLAVLTFLVISPCRLPDTQIVIRTGKSGAEATVTYTGQLISLLNPIQLNSAGGLLQVFLAGGLVFSGFTAAILSMPLNPGRYEAKVPPRRWTEELEVKLLNFLYARPRLVRSFAIITALLACLGYYQAVRLIYERWYLGPVSMVSYIIMLSAFLFFPRSVIILWNKRRR